MVKLFFASVYSCNSTGFSRGGEQEQNDAVSSGAK